MCGIVAQYTMHTRHEIYMLNLHVFLSFFHITFFYLVYFLFILINFLVQYEIFLDTTLDQHPHDRQRGLFIYVELCLIVTSPLLFLIFIYVFTHTCQAFIFIYLMQPFMWEVFYPSPNAYLCHQDCHSCSCHPSHTRPTCSFLMVVSHPQIPCKHALLSSNQKVISNSIRNRTILCMHACMRSLNNILDKSRERGDETWTMNC